MFNSLKKQRLHSVFTTSQQAVESASSLTATRKMSREYLADDVGALFFEVQGTTPMLPNTFQNQEL